MGIFNNKKKAKPEKDDELSRLEQKRENLKKQAYAYLNTLNAEQNSSLKKQQERIKAKEDVTTYMQGAIDQSNRSPSAQRINSVASKQAQEMLSRIEMRKQKAETNTDISSSQPKEADNTPFEVKYQKIDEFKREFESQKDGKQDAQNQSEYMKRYNVLSQKGVISEEDKKALFLPYLYEKQARGMSLNQNEQAELDVTQLGNYDELNMNRAPVYYKALIILQALGVLQQDGRNSFSNASQVKSIARWFMLNMVNDKTLIDGSHALEELATIPEEEMSSDSLQFFKSSYAEHLKIDVTLHQSNTITHHGRPAFRARVPISASVTNAIKNNATLEDVTSADTIADEILANLTRDNDGGITHE